MGSTSVFLSSSIFCVLTKRLFLINNSKHALNSSHSVVLIVYFTPINTNPYNLLCFSHQVRSKSASALGQLVVLSTRIDPLINDLCSSSVQAESNAIRASFLQAVAEVLDAAGDKASEGVMQNIAQTVLACLTSEEEQVEIAFVSSLHFSYLLIRFTILYAFLRPTFTNLFNTFLTSLLIYNFLLFPIPKHLSPAIYSGPQRIDRSDFVSRCETPHRHWASLRHDWS
jgi:hypothetical protein